MKNPVRFLRHAGLIEGASFIVLVGIAMPLKYVWNMPMNSSFSTPTWVASQ